MQQHASDEHRDGGASDQSVAAPEASSLAAQDSPQNGSQNGSQNGTHDSGSDSNHDRPGGCPMDAVLRTLMGTWTTYILWLLRSEERLRFGEIKALMPGISSKVLTERLRHLEASGLVDREYRRTIPPMVSYALTQKGRELKDVLDSLDMIARRWRAEDITAASTAARATE
jgi:DNA-binding HxlR family transcriptional regulator